MEQAIALLEPLLLPRRIQRMREVLATRSDHVAFVFERMVDPHNLSAVLRSLDAISFQDVYLMAPQERVVLSRAITQGTERWLSVQSHEDPAACLAVLRERGYRIYASHVAPDRGLPLQALDVSRPLALVFGNEHGGVSDAVLAQADETFHIPMHGFVESLNLSVAAAISAHHLRERMDALAAASPDAARFLLPPARQRALYARWLYQSVRHAERILAEAGCDWAPAD
jgi:tRNA (guanosine-2'-O-)-methyltransferase